MKLTIENLKNQLEHNIKTSPELKGITIQTSDARIGKKVALGRLGESGSLNILTDFITYQEMQQFLRGYLFKATNRLNKQ